MNYEADLKIDETALDVEWIEQPSLMFKYTRIAAEAEQDMDEAKERLDFVSAELDSEIRTDPDKFDVAKITETTVANTILQQDTYKEASRKYIEAKFNAKIANGAVRSFDQRKTALENLVRLHGQAYFAGPAVPRDLHSEMEQRHERQRVTDSHIAARIQRTRTPK